MEVIIFLFPPLSTQNVVVDDKLTFSNQCCLHDIRILPMPISDEITEAHGHGIAKA